MRTMLRFLITASILAAAGGGECQKISAFSLYPAATAPTGPGRTVSASDESPPIDSVARVTPVLRGPEFITSLFDATVIAKFQESWDSVSRGMLPFERVILILKATGGQYQARLQKATYEYKSSTFAWHPATVAVIHTHPNNSPAAPQPPDIAIADKYQVPMFTITSRGMYVYDPKTQKTTRVMNGLDWLDPQNWARGLAFKR